MLEQVADDGFGRLTLAGIVPKLSASPGRIERSGGRIGRDTQAVLTRLADVSDAEIAALEAQGVIRTAAPEASAESRSEEHTSELQSLMRISYAVFCLKKKKNTRKNKKRHNTRIKQN